MPNTNEENKNAGSETGQKRVWNESKNVWEKIENFASRHNTVTGLILYLYSAVVGYVYDHVYYLHYGLDILKYERPEDLIFSIFNHWVLITAIPLAIFLTIVLLIFFGVLLEKFEQRLKAGNGQKGSDDEKSEKSGKPEGKQEEQIKNGNVGIRHHLRKMIGWILQKILWAKIGILVILTLMMTFWLASWAAQKEVANVSENNAEGRLYTVDPNRHLDDVIHIGSTADYMIFLKNGNNNAGGGSNVVCNSGNQEERGIWIWLSDPCHTWLRMIPYCLLNWCYQFDREKGFVFVVPTSNVASFDVKIKDRTVDKGTKDAPSDKVTKDRTLDNLWMPAAENRSFPESYLFISPDTQSTYSQFIPYVVVDPRKYRKPQKPQKPEIKVPLVYSLPYIKPGESELDRGHKEWLRQFYDSAQAYSEKNRPVRIRVRGFASNEPFKDKKGNEIPNSDIQNCRLANTRARKVKDFLKNLAKNTPDETRDNGSQIIQSCERPEPISASGMGESGSQIVCSDESSKLDGAPFTIEFDPWRTPQELDEQRLVEHRIDWGTIKPDFLNRSVHIIIEDAGKCSNRGDDEP